MFLIDCFVLQMPERWGLGPCLFQGLDLHFRFAVELAGYCCYYSDLAEACLPAVFAVLTDTRLERAVQKRIDLAPVDAQSIRDLLRLEP